MGQYYRELKGTTGLKYLKSQPKKTEAIKNANKVGNAKVLKNSNNRAIVIENSTYIFLQSYDTPILRVDKRTHTIKKLWNGYSHTTIKHVNEFMYKYGIQFNKKDWMEFTEMTY